MTDRRRTRGIRDVATIEQQRELAPSAIDSLTPQNRSVAVDDNVRELLDWLVDEELRRWQLER